MQLQNGIKPSIGPNVCTLQRRFSGGDAPRLALQNKLGGSGRWSAYGIPKFYFPAGKPYSQAQIEAIIRKAMGAFDSLPNRRATRAEFGQIIKACDVPLYWKEPIFLAVSKHRKALSTRSQSFDGPVNRPSDPKGGASLPNPLVNGDKFDNRNVESISCDQFCDYWRK